jgi:hypothetical protein
VSPIDIITNDVVTQVHFKTIDFNYSNDTTLTVKNGNSPNVEGTIKGIPSAGSRLSYDGYVYNLLQFHFHEEAEHTINGYRAPMEIHFVNQQAGSSDADGLLVVGRFIEVIAQDNPLLIEFFSGTSGIPNPDDQFVINNFDVAAFCHPARRSTGIPVHSRPIPIPNRSTGTCSWVFPSISHRTRSTSLLRLSHTAMPARFSLWTAGPFTLQQFPRSPRIAL